MKSKTRLITLLANKYGAEAAALVMLTYASQKDRYVRNNDGPIKPRIDTV